MRAGVRGGTSESLADVLRRTWRLIAIYVVLAVVAVNVIGLLQGSRYEASSVVTVSPFDVSTAIARQEPAAVDPARDLATQATLARSDELYVRAADASGASLGSAEDLQNDVEVSTSGDENSITFTATSGSETKAGEVAQLVGIEFINWRTEVLNNQIDRAIAAARAGADGPIETNAQIARLENLRSAAAASYTLIERGSEPEQVSPDVVRNSGLGLAIGLVVGLIVVGVREGFTSSVRSASDAEELLGLPTLVAIDLPRPPVDKSFVDDAQTWGSLDLLAGVVWASRSPEPRPLTVATVAATDDPGASVLSAGLAIALTARSQGVLFADLREPAGAGSALLLGDGDAGGPNLRGHGLWKVTVERGGIPSGPVRDDEGGAARGVVLVGRATAGGAEPDELRDTMGVPQRAGDVMVVDPRPGLEAADAIDLSAGGATILVVATPGETRRRALRRLASQIERWPTPPIGIAVIGGREGRAGRAAHDREGSP